MPAIDDFAQKRRRDRIDEMSGEAAGRLHVYRIAPARFFVALRRIGIVEPVPELRRVDAHVLDPVEREFLRVDVVDGEKARYSETARRRRHQPGHPVVAVDQVGLHARNAVVYYLPLEGESELYVSVAAVVNSVPVVEAAVLGEMDAFVGQMALVLSQLVGNELRRLFVEHAPVVRQRHMDVRAEFVERGNERSGDVGHAAGLGRHLAREVAHAVRQIGNLRGDYQNSRIGRSGHWMRRAPFTLSPPRSPL